MSVRALSLSLEAAIPERVKYTTQTGKAEAVRGATLKIVLVVLADHAGMAGEGAYPSLATIARKTSLTPRAVQKALRALEALGLIAAKGKTRSGTVVYTLNLEALAALGGQGANQVQGGGEPGSPKPSFNRQVNNPPKGGRAEGPPTPQEPEKPENLEKPDRATLYAMAKTLAEVCQVDFAANRGRLFREAKIILQAGYTPEAIRAAYSRGGAWYRRDWRGRKGEPPTPATIRETMARFAASNASNLETKPVEVPIQRIGEVEHDLR